MAPELRMHFDFLQVHAYKNVKIYIGVSRKFSGAAAGAPAE